MNTDLSLNLRAEVELFKGSDDWAAVTVARSIPADRCALLLCDVWDDHWCRSAARRCDVIAGRLAQLVEKARARGVQIIHAPSDCMEFYEGSPERERMLKVPPAAPPANRDITDPPLPIDDSDGGCDDQPQCPQRKAWTRQHPAISVAAPDVVSDSGEEVYGLVRSQDIRLVLIAGVHTNMCVLKRSFAIRQLTRWGVPCALVRDLTDTMYNPRRWPFVDHDKGTELVIRHIERHWCPTVLSDEILSGAGARGSRTNSQ